MGRQVSLPAELPLLQTFLSRCVVGGGGGGEYGTGWIPELGSLAAHPGSATYRLCDFDALLFFFFSPVPLFPNLQNKNNNHFLPQRVVLRIN